MIFLSSHQELAITHKNNLIISELISELNISASSEYKMTNLLNMSNNID
jgi:hypothetical protein